MSTASLVIFILAIGIAIVIALKEFGFRNDDDEPPRPDR